MPSDVLCAQLTRDQFAIAKFLFCLSQIGNLSETFTCRYGHYAGGRYNHSHRLVIMDARSA